MKTKLTLQIDEQVINPAKIFAKNHHISLSKFAENYFKILNQKENGVSEKIPGIVGELAGLLKDKNVEDSREHYTDYLENKCSLTKRL